MASEPIVDAGAALNPRQEDACSTLSGQLMVLAGPGTGKTRVVTYRYLNLLATPGVDTDNIVVLTFTEKAAREMEERIASLCATGYKELWVSTFHAFANRFLRDEGGRLPIPHPFRMAPEVEKWSAMCRVLERLRPTELYRLPRPREVAPDLLKLLERAKQEMAGPQDYMEVAQRHLAGRRLGSDVEVQVAEVYQAYQDDLGSRGFLDFDDTIYWTVRLLESDESVLRRYRARFKQIMVDEFQDTNYAQMRMVELLAGEAGNIAVVGDDDQSIYKFRGASVANLRRFRKVYPALKIVRLEDNYRSTRQVLEPANRLIEANQERVRKAVGSPREGPAIRLYAAPGRDHEVAWAVERIVDLVEGRGGDAAVPAGEIAVLVRTNAQLRPYARALQRAGLPYQLSGGRGFLDQAEIKDLRALLQLVADPADAQAACRVLAMPGVELPATLILDFAAGARRSELPVEEMAAAAMERAGAVPEEDARRLRRLLATLTGLRAISLRERVDEVVFQCLEQTHYVDLLDYPSEIQRRQAGANVSKFVDLVDAFCDAGAGDGEASVARFVEYLVAVEASGSEQTIAPIEAGTDAVHLMTVHQAKGLEFTAVIVPGVVEERFPQRGQAERLQLPAELVAEEMPSRDAGLAEERRLFYVAVTRARSHLLLSYSERYEGSKRWKPSRFLHEMGLLPGPDGTLATPPAVEPAPAVEAPLPVPAAQATLPISHPDVPELVVSFTQLESYRTCPRQYQYRYIYKLPTRPSAEQEFGVKVHAALARILRAAPSGQPSLDDAVAVFDEVFDAAHFCDPVNADLWQERGQNFIRALHARGRLSGASLHLPPEQSFNLRLDGFRVQGRIDRIDRNGAGVKLIDYKTGEPKQEWELDRDLQLGLYAIAAVEVLGLRPVDLAICNIDDALEVPVLKTTSQLQADRETASVAAAGIIAGDFTPQPTAWKCRGCDFRLVCDAAL